MMLAEEAVVPESVVEASVLEEMVAEFWEVQNILLSVAEYQIVFVDQFENLFPKVETDLEPMVQ